ncbi:MAG: glycosyltransferase family 2 protein [Phycisphaerales bacterium]|nr:glycosyltransferase family 2 protein [Phycisphaerales bacterium]MCI0630981.1 glycosyltransferase family 2 protein [Phycisphaerales bacterium]MCI0676775.1 glycosyltransferase family 2 protein [Phycisphaerales bacterium]
MKLAKAQHGPKILLGIPVYNEQNYVAKVLDEVRRHARDVLVVDDGSTDCTPMLLAQQPVEVIRHAENRGYGRSMQDMIRWAAVDGFDWLITMDCDEQHEPAAIPTFVERIKADESDVISGSRYLAQFDNDDAPPSDRREINQTITEELNRRLKLSLTDAFCGFKAYRIAACERLCLNVDGYDFPMQFWVQAAANDLAIEELPVRLIYNDPSRSFGGPLDDPKTRLEVYRRTMHREVLRCRNQLPASASVGLERYGVVPERRCRTGTL